MRRRVGLFLLAGLLAPLAMAAEASAQGAALSVSPASAAPGQLVTVTGTGYTQSSINIEGGIDIRLSTRESTPLATTSVSGNSGFVASFPAPSVAPGEYLLIGTEVSVPGRHVFGAPGRAKLRITAAKGAAAATPGGGAPPPALLAGTALALLALAAGMTLSVRRLRTRSGRTQPTFSR